MTDKEEALAGHMASASRPPGKIDPKTPLKIAGGRPVSEAFLNNFFKVFSVEQILTFEYLYQELEPLCRRINMNGEAFMQQIRDAYSRYQEHKGVDVFEPMDRKGQQYVEKFMRESVAKIHSQVTGKR